jgi:hypothetical protein
MANKCTKVYVLSTVINSSTSVVHKLEKCATPWGEEGMVPLSWMCGTDFIICIFK